MQNRTETSNVELIPSFLPSHSTHPYQLINDLNKCYKKEGKKKKKRNYTFYFKNKEPQVDLNRLRPINRL